MAPDGKGDVYVLTAGCVAKYTASGDRAWARKTPGDASEGSILLDPEGRPVVRTKYEVQKWDTQGKDVWSHKRDVSAGPGYEHLLAAATWRPLRRGTPRAPGTKPALDIE